MRFPEWLIRLSIIVNTITFGPKGASICARLYDNERKGSKVSRWLRILTDKLFYFDPGHCKKAYVRWRTIRISNNLINKE